MLLKSKPTAIELFDTAKGAILTYLYRDPDFCLWGKKIHITGFIQAKEYDLIKDKKGKIDHIWAGEPPAGYKAFFHFKPASRQRKLEDTRKLAEIETCGLAARGTRFSDKAVALVKVVKG